MSSIERHEAGPVLTLVPPPARPGRPRGPNWAAAEDAVLRAHYGRRTAADLGAQLGRSHESVRQRARALGLAHPVRARIRWTAAADALVREQYGRRTAGSLAAELGTTEAAVWARVRQLGIQNSVYHRPWTAADDRLLCDLEGTMPRATLAAHLGRSWHAVGGRLKTLGLTRTTAVADRYARDQATITQLRQEISRREAARPLDADGRRLAVLIAYRMQVVTAAEAAVVLGVPVERLPVELGKAAARGLDVVREALGEG